ncbi:MAG: hypothetical protein NWR73_00150 [Flavobacteriales bacterium]|nr:hypothetical protein [Flavobacteriales bacterium]
MMKRLLTICAGLLLTLSVFAQAPEKMSYQAVVRDGNNVLVTSSPVGMQINILQGSANGTSVYEETQTLTTNANGLVSAEIGAGTVTSGDFSSIDWANGPYFVKTEIDPTGGTNYTISGTTELLSVPYALYAANSGSSTPGPQGIAGADGEDGADGNGIASTTANGDGTVTFVYTDGSTFTTTALTGPQGDQGPMGPAGPQGIQGIQGIQGPIGETGPQGPAGMDGNGIVSTSDNGDGTITFTFDDGSTFTTTDLTGPQGPQGDQGPIGPTGPQGPQGPAGTVNSGSAVGDMLFWDGSTWVELPIGQQQQILTVCGGIPTWTIGGICPAIVTSFDCGNASNTGGLSQGIAASGVTSTINYSGGNGGAFADQNIASTGVVGLTATLAAGSINEGAGSLTFDITGTPTSSGTANFMLDFGGQSCTLSLTVAEGLDAQYAPGSVFCATGPTAIVEVINPTTGRIWMDRNLGAAQVATSLTDVDAYGDTYQWGRRTDGHQCRTSPTIATLSNTDTPAHGSFITLSSTPYDWRSPQNPNLWQGINGVNNPCPSGFRLPTAAELTAERQSWSSNNMAGAFASPLKLTLGGHRFYNGAPNFVGNTAYYASSTPNSSDASILSFNNNSAAVYAFNRAFGYSVRCIKD